MPNRPAPAAETTALLRIQAVRKELADAEGRVADFICQNPRSVIRMAITELAARCETSEATVMRMCRKDGLPGFSGFQDHPGSGLVSPVETIQQGLQEGDTPDIVIDKTFRSLVETLEHTRRLLQAETFETVTKLLREARQIDIYGSGNSAAVARDFHHKLRRLGLQATAYEDSHMQIISATALGPSDVAIGVSQRQLPVRRRRHSHCQKPRCRHRGPDELRQLRSGHRVRPLPAIGSRKRQFPRRRYAIPHRPAGHHRCLARQPGPG